MLNWVAILLCMVAIKNWVGIQHIADNNPEDKLEIFISQKTKLQIEVQ